MLLGERLSHLPTLPAHHQNSRYVPCGSALLSPTAVKIWDRKPVCHSHTVRLCGLPMPEVPPQEKMAE